MGQSGQSQSCNVWFTCPRLRVSYCRDFPDRGVRKNGDAGLEGERTRSPSHRTEQARIRASRLPGKDDRRHSEAARVSASIPPTCNRIARFKYFVVATKALLFNVACRSALITCLQRIPGRILRDHSKTSDFNIRRTRTGIAHIRWVWVAGLNTPQCLPLAHDMRSLAPPPHLTDLLPFAGLPNIDIDDLRQNTEYHKYQTNSLQIQWFWRALRSFDQAERAKFLQFVTGA